MARWLPCCTVTEDCDCLFGHSANFVWRVAPGVAGIVPHECPYGPIQTGTVAMRLRECVVIVMVVGCVAVEQYETPGCARPGEGEKTCEGVNLPGYVASGAASELECDADGECAPRPSPEVGWVNPALVCNGSLVVGSSGSLVVMSPGDVRVFVDGRWASLIESLRAAEAVVNSKASMQASVAGALAKAQADLTVLEQARASRIGAAAQAAVDAAASVGEVRGQLEQLQLQLENAGAGFVLGGQCSNCAGELQRLQAELNTIRELVDVPERELLLARMTVITDDLILRNVSVTALVREVLHGDVARNTSAAQAGCAEAQRQCRLAAERAAAAEALMASVNDTTRELLGPDVQVLDAMRAFTDALGTAQGANATIQAWRISAQEMVLEPEGIDVRASVLPGVEAARRCADDKALAMAMVANASAIMDRAREVAANVSALELEIRTVLDSVNDMDADTKKMMQSASKVFDADTGHGTFDVLEVRQHLTVGGEDMGAVATACKSAKTAADAANGLKSSISNALDQVSQLQSSLSGVQSSTSDELGSFKDSLDGRVSKLESFKDGLGSAIVFGSDQSVTVRAAAFSVPHGSSVSVDSISAEGPLRTGTLSVAGAMHVAGALQVGSLSGQGGSGSTSVSMSGTRLSLSGDGLGFAPDEGAACVVLSGTPGAALDGPGDAVRSGSMIATVQPEATSAQLPRLRCVLS